MFQVYSKEELIVAVVGIFLFLFRNPDKNYRFLVSVFVLGLFVSQAAFNYLDNELPSQIIWIVSAIGLIVFYTLRFQSKPEKSAIDFLKPFALLWLIIYPFPFYNLFYVDNSTFWTIIPWTIVHEMTFYVLGAIYLYDRLILKPTPMKRKFIIVLVIQTIFIGIMYVYAFVQQIEASKNAKIANEQRVLAENAVLEVDRATEELERELESCRTGKVK